MWFHRRVVTLCVFKKRTRVSQVASNLAHATWVLLQAVNSVYLLNTFLRWGRFLISRLFCLKRIGSFRIVIKWLWLHLRTKFWSAVQRIALLLINRLLDWRKGFPARSAGGKRSLTHLKRLAFFIGRQILQTQTGVDARLRPFIWRHWLPRLFVVETWLLLWTWRAKASAEYRNYFVLSTLYKIMAILTQFEQSASAEQIYPDARH